MSNQPTKSRSECVRDICADLQKTLERKATGYREEPSAIWPVEFNMDMVIMKGYRAREAVTRDKRVDELRDAACYAILALMREMGDGDIPADPALDTIAQMARIRT